MAQTSMKKKQSGNPKGRLKYLATEGSQTIRYVEDLAEAILAKGSLTLAVWSFNIFFETEYWPKNNINLINRPVNQKLYSIEKDSVLSSLRIDTI